ncbi:MAG: helix-turn-helix transcriptional regulator [Clostridium sp.]
MQLEKTKIYRIIELYQRFNNGEVMSKKKISYEYGVDLRTVQRYIKDLNDFFEEHDKDKNEPVRKIKYNSQRSVYELINRNSESNLSDGDMLAICKILFESRAFSKSEMERIINTLTAKYNNDKLMKDALINEEFNYEELKHNKNEKCGKTLSNFLWQINKSISERKVIEAVYTRKDNLTKPLRLKPLAIVFNEYYFYLMAQNADNGSEYTYSFRVDRFKEYKVTDEEFKIDYRDKFKEGEFRKKIHFMYKGELTHIQFKFWGDSLEAVLDRIPTAEIIGWDGDKAIVEGEVYSKGAIMWLLSQMEFLEVIRPESLRQEMKEKIKNMYKLYNE